MVATIQKAVIGWRKLAAWGFVQAGIFYLAYMAMSGQTGAVDLPENLMKVTLWNGGFFFGANTLKHGFNMVQSVLGKVRIVTEE